MEEHSCIPNPITRDVIFLGGHCTYKGAPEPIPFKEEPALKTETKKRKRKQKRKSMSQKLCLKEAERLSEATTPFRRSTRYTLLKEVDEDEVAEYYESWEPVAEISYIAACATAILISRLEVMIAAI